MSCCLMVTSFSASIHAESINQTLNSTLIQDPSDETIITWQLDIKFGPYLPGIDREFDHDNGPYEIVFGTGRSLLTQFELDAFLSYSWGQLGLGAEVGWFRNSAKALLDFSKATDSIERSETDTTSLSIVPVSAKLIYRVTALNDYWNIPFIPYGKVGLIFGLWWVTDPNGNIASITDDNDMTQPMMDANGNITTVTNSEINTEHNRGIGVSLGWQYTIGISFQASRLDPWAERSLQRDLGIHNAGFFAELTTIDMDVFNRTQLRLGDTLWLAGINFEF